MVLIYKVDSKNLSKTPTFQELKKPNDSAPEANTKSNKESKKSNETKINNQLHNSISHNDHWIREAIAKHSLNENDLDHLCSDKHPIVRAAIAVRGRKRHLDILVRDSDPFVRQAVARHGHKEHLDILVNDHDPNVRNAVAKRGHVEHLDKLINDTDPNYLVRDTARKLVYKY